MAPMTGLCDHHLSICHLKVSQVTALVMLSDIFVIDSPQNANGPFLSLITNVVKNLLT